MTKAPAVPPRAVTLAVIIGAHGVAGEVRLKIYAEDGIAGLKAHGAFNGGTLTLDAVRDGANGAIARLAGVTDRTAAEALRGTELWVPREALPPLADGEYYHTDLIGLIVVDERGTAFGRVVGVDNFGAGDLIEIEPDQGTGGRFLVPMTRNAVPGWDARAITVTRDFLPAR